MVSAGLSTEQARQIWQPFLDSVKHSSQCSIKGITSIGSIPARHWWDPQWWKEHWPEIAFPRDGAMHAIIDDVLLHVMHQPVFTFDPRPGASPHNAWWVGHTGEASSFWWAYHALWLPESRLETRSQHSLADALFAASRYAGIELHFNKVVLPGAPPDAIAAAKDTATNPSVLSAFALAIVADGQGPSYPGIAGHEPSVEAGRKAAARIDQCMSELGAVAPNGGAYVSESNYFEKNFQQAYQAAVRASSEIKKKYDPSGLFIVHNGVGSRGVERHGFTKL